MNYTNSDANVVDPSTGNRKHQSNLPVPTEVSAADMNMVIWSLMALLNASGIAGADFDPEDPDTYSKLLGAVQFLIGPGNPSSIKALPDVGVLTSAAAAANLTALTAALAVRRSKLLVPEGDFQVTGAFDNKYGTELAPGGRITKPITGGRQQLNLSADIGQHVFGQEYLWAFHESIRAQSNGVSSNIVFSGDSTTYGTGGNGATAPFLINQIVEILGRESGYNVVGINNGQAGKNTYHWRTQYLADDLAANPKLLVLRWGINDPGWLKDNSTPPIDSGQSYPNRRDITDFITDLRGGLTQIRQTAGLDVGNLSILLMTPNSTADTPNGRDEIWYEQVRLAVRQAARDFKCAFIDTYALWVDSRAANSLWMDELLVGRAIHPHNTMNGWIATKIAEIVFPRGLRPSFLSGVYGIQPEASAPDDFKIGFNLARCDATSAFPGTLDGAVLTVRTPDNIGFQMVWDYQEQAIPRMPAIRFGSGGAWHDWISRTHVDLAVGNGWVPYAAETTLRVSKGWKMVTISGEFKSGTVTTGTVIATLPEGSRPYAIQRFVVPCGASFDQSAYVQVRPTGEIAIQSCPSNAGLALDGITFEAFK